jgi:soluble lytic murein transglycosylase-like protein
MKMTTPCVAFLCVVVSLCIVISLYDATVASIHYEKAASPTLCPADEKAHEPLIHKRNVIAYVRLFNTDISDDDALTIAVAIVDMSDAMNVSYKKIAAIAATESRFNPSAYNAETNCIGLMQVRPNFAGQDINLGELQRAQIIKSKRDLYIIHKNIMAGIYIYSRALKRSENQYEALRRYCGSTSKKSGDQFVYAVVANYNRFEEVL